MPSQRVPDDSKWRLLELKTVASELDLVRVVIFERTDRTAPPRVWCQGLIDEGQWAQVDVERDGDRLRIDLPPSGYYGMPARMFIGCPKQVVVGSKWVVWGEDGQHVLATLAMLRGLPQSSADVVRIETFYEKGGTRAKPQR